MSFASYPFILLFLPASVLGCLVLGRLGTRAAMAALVVGSLVFYGWSDPRLVMLLVFDTAREQDFRLGCAKS